MVLDPRSTEQSLLQQQAEAVAARLLVLVRDLFAPDDKSVADLPLRQLRVCGVLYQGPRPMSALSRELGISLSAMTQIADRLERARLVRRVANRADRRMKYLQLTERGQNILRTREQSRVRRVSALLEGLPAESRRAVLSALQTLAAQSEAIPRRQPEIDECVEHGPPRAAGTDRGLPAVGSADREGPGFPFSEVKAIP